MSQPNQRHTLIDWLRAFAIMLMVIYHFLFDLQSFHIISYEAFTSFGVTAIGRSCLAIFMFCVGYSLALGHANSIHWPAFWRRWIKIAGAAALVSIATFINYSHNWIYFGILHCIALSSLLALPLLRFPTLSFCIGISMLIAYAGFNLDFALFTQAQQSLDFIPIYPWSWSLWLGISAYHWKLSEKCQPPYSSLAEKSSRHSLIIYLVHQPILMALAYTISLCLR